MADDREILFAFIVAFTLGTIYMYLKKGQSTVPPAEPIYTHYSAYERPQITTTEPEPEVVITNTEEIKPEFDEKGRIIGMIITREVKRVSG